MGHSQTDSGGLNLPLAFHSSMAPTIKTIETLPCELCPRSLRRVPTVLASFDSRHSGGVECKWWKEMIFTLSTYAVCEKLKLHHYIMFPLFRKYSAISSISPMCGLTPPDGTPCSPPQMPVLQAHTDPRSKVFQ